jgi:hypothetical protein
MLEWSTDGNGSKFAARLFKNIRRWSVGDLGNAGKRFGKEHTLFGHPQATKARDFIKNNKFHIFAYSNEPFKSGLMELFQHCFAIDSERTIRDDTSEYSPKSGADSRRRGTFVNLKESENAEFGSSLFNLFRIDK